MSTAKRPITETMEEYLQAIYYLGKDGRPVIAARIADWLGVAPPSVTAMLGRLRAEGLIDAAERREVRLTARGQAEARSIARRHYLAERLLTDLLGLGWAEAHAEADRWEHAISPATEERLLDVLGRPQTCPHGNPIPGTGGRISPNAFPLARAEPGERVVVSHIDEAAEENSALLARYESLRLRPGHRLTVEAIDRSTGEVALRGDAGAVGLPMQAASLVYVLPERLASEAPRRPRPRLRRTDHLAAALRRALPRLHRRPTHPSHGAHAR